MKFDMDSCWERIRAGDLKAYELFYKQWYPAMCYYAKQLTNNGFAAEEITQDTFLKMWQNRHTIFSKDQSIKNFLYRTVHNNCINYCIRQKTQKERLLTFASSRWWYEIGEQFAYDESLLDELHAKETQRKIELLIEGLPAQCREIFKLSRFDDKTNDEIAALLDISVNTVRTQIYRALNKIKSAL